jgi:ADP-heptose:LPS heptosyltransferase
MASNSAIRSVVIPVAAGVGNAIMAEPMVRQLAHGLGPETRITIVARTNAIAEPLRRTSGVTDVRVTGDGVRGFANFIRFTHQANPDLYLIPFPSNRWQYNFLATLSGARRVLIHDYPVGYWRALHFLPAERVHAEPGWHDVRQNLNLLRPLGIEPHYAMDPGFELNDVDHDAAAELLRESGADADKPFIAIHAGSGKTVFGEAKRWPVEKFAQLIDVLSRRTDQNIAIVEGPDEAGIAADVLRHVETNASDGRIVAVPLRGNLGVGGGGAGAGERVRGVGLRAGTPGGSGGDACGDRVRSHRSAHGSSVRERGPGRRAAKALRALLHVPVQDALPFGEVQPAVVHRGSGRGFGGDDGGAGAGDARRRSCRRDRAAGHPVMCGRDLCPRRRRRPGRVIRRDFRHRDRRRGAATRVQPVAGHVQQFFR